MSTEVTEAATTTTTTTTATTEAATTPAPAVPTLFQGKTTCPKEGDCVVLYATKAKMFLINKLESGKTFSCEFGNYLHSDIIGKAYGSRVNARGKVQGWLTLLRTTPEIWSRVLRHRTQILYSTDISMIIFNLGIGPGSVVVESGTGSGSLTYSLAWAAGRTGHVYTFEFHEQRAEQARNELTSLLGQWDGIGNVTVTHADACNDGFLHPQDGADLAGKVDAVFLDLPSPWLAVPHAYAVMKPGAGFCAFSPCIEQVQRTCEELAKDNRFHMIKMIECLERPYDIKKNDLLRIDSVGLNVKGKKRPFSQLRTNENNDNSAVPLKEQKVEGEDKKGDCEKVENEEVKEEEKVKEEVVEEEEEEEEEFVSMALPSTTTLMAKPTTSIKGHTGFLLFAYKSIIPAEPVAAETTQKEPEPEVKAEVKPEEITTTEN